MFFSLTAQADGDGQKKNIDRQKKNNLMNVFFWLQKPTVQWNNGNITDMFSLSCVIPS